MRFIVLTDIDPFTHTFKQLGGAGDRTSNLAVTSQPSLPPELMPLTYQTLSLFLQISNQHSLESFIDNLLCALGTTGQTICKKMNMQGHESCKLTGYGLN